MARRDAPAPAARLAYEIVESPPGLMLRALGAIVAGRAVDEWRATRLYRALLNRPAAKGFAVEPRDPRPARAALGREIIEGRIELAGAKLELGPGGDPWDRPSPSRLFAVALHRYAWAPHLLEVGEDGAREFLRLFFAWRELFDRVAPFAWGGDILPRRVFNLACVGRSAAAVASDAEAAILATSLAAQARHLLRLPHAPASAPERLCAAALAGAVLSGPAGEGLLQLALPRLSKSLAESVLPDGGLKTRSPEGGLELLLDLLTLDDALLQRGLEAPAEMARSIDRLSAATRFFTLGDGALAAFHGGEAADPARAAAAAAIHHEAEGRIYGYAPHAGYHRLSGRALQVVVDAAPPPEGPWSLAACAQPLAIEVSAGRDRLIVNCGWSPDAAAPQALRLTAGGSTATLDETSAGRPLTGFPARVLGARLIGAPARVEARRNENEGGVWLELAHDGWARSYGLIHERRLFLDPLTDELRGEDRFTPSAEGFLASGPVALAVRFHLHPDVQVSLARDRRSALLRGPSNHGWWFRNDASEVTLEPSVAFLDGQPRRTSQLVMRGAVGEDGARVRWKLTPVDEKR